MIFVFLPYYTPDSKDFTQSINNQTVEFQLIRRDRKRDKIYWSKACNDFLEDFKYYRGVYDTDVVCIMNNDIKFSERLLEEGSKVKQGEVYIPKSLGVHIDWKRKSFTEVNDEKLIDCFPGRCFFITAKDFKQSGGFSKLLPMYLSDYEFSIRQLKKLKPVVMDEDVIHEDHPREAKFYSVLSPANPLFWTIFLLKTCRNIFLPLNILKAWWIYSNHYYGD